MHILNKCSIQSWMADSFLQLNEETMDVLVCAPDRFVPTVITLLVPLSSFVKLSVRSFGVTLNSALTLDSHVRSLVYACF